MRPATIVTFVERQFRAFAIQSRDALAGRIFTTKKGKSRRGGELIRSRINPVNPAIAKRCDHTRDGILRTADTESRESAPDVQHRSRMLSFIN